MTDMTKYRNVSLSRDTYDVLEKLSKIMVPEIKLSVAKTIELITKEKTKSLNGKMMDPLEKRMNKILKKRSRR